MQKHNFRQTIHKICLVASILLLLGAALTAYNLYTDWYAGQASQSIVEQMPAPASEQTQQDPDYWNGPMPEVEIDGSYYIGTVEIPDLDVCLPVHTEWSSANAKTAPCRYIGSAYDGSLIIAGHNYQSHFGRLSELEVGSTVIFTDVKGAVFEYEVESIDMYDLDAMEVGEWDLTLFTCDASRVCRTTVRCKELSRTAPAQ